MFKDIPSPIRMLELLCIMVLAYMLFRAIRKKIRKEVLWSKKYKSYRNIILAIISIRIWANETYCSCHVSPLIETIDTDKRALTLTARIGRFKNFVTASESIHPENFTIYIKKIIYELNLEEFRARVDGAYSEGPEASEQLSTHAENVMSIIGTHLPVVIKLVNNDLS